MTSHKEIYYKIHQQERPSYNTAQGMSYSDIKSCAFFVNQAENKENWSCYCVRIVENEQHLIWGMVQNLTS